MLFEKTYGIDLGSSSVKVYSLFKNKSYMEKNMIASRGHKIIAVGNEAYEMFEKSPAEVAVCSPMSFGMICQSGTAGDRAVQYDTQDRSHSGGRICNVFYSSSGYDSC